uniref:Uncharacterized protein n=1 Tax=Rhipicephalus appendiculatus TaxID=34631 RepID=A0A131YDE7_RHIAP
MRRPTFFWNRLYGNISKPLFRHFCISIYSFLLHALQPRAFRYHDGLLKKAPFFYTVYLSVWEPPRPSHAFCSVCLHKHGECVFHHVV